MQRLVFTILDLASSITKHWTYLRYLFHMGDDVSFQSEVHRATGNVTIHSILIDLILSIGSTVIVGWLLLLSVQESTIFILRAGEIDLDRTMGGENERGIALRSYRKMCRDRTYLETAKKSFGDRDCI